MRYLFTLLAVTFFAPSVVAEQINMNVYRQQQTNWCWVATSLAVGDYMVERNGALGRAVYHQCTLVGSVLYSHGDAFRNFCCDAERASSAGCNRPGDVSAALAELDIPRRQVNGQLNGARFNTLSNEIAAGRPVIGAIQWSGQNVGHAIIVYGMGFGGIAGGQAVYIYDPTTGRQVGLTGARGLNTYGAAANGGWRASYFVSDF